MAEEGIVSLRNGVPEVNWLTDAQRLRDACTRVLRDRYPSWATTEETQDG